MEVKRYYIWTIGCQMNKAESGKIAAYFEAGGYIRTGDPRYADVIILNTCVVRQSAEDKITGHLGYLKGIKKQNPNKKIVLTGCFVADSSEQVRQDYPHVDISFPPGDFASLEQWALSSKCALVPEEYPPLPEDHISPCAYVPIIQGCNNFCAYCIVPYRRGREHSRPVNDIVREVEALLQRGIKEVTLLGQNVNSYGNDLGKNDGLSELLTCLNRIPGLARIRFLTNHPKDMREHLIEVVSSLDKVCEHINVPFQAGDNYILAKMRRSYTRETYIELIEKIREHIPSVSLSTDVIVGFPGETEAQFERSYDMLERIRFANSHIAAYSERQGTIAAREFNDDVPPAVKKKRLAALESLQERISTEVNELLIGKDVEILVEGKKKNKWFGRTRSDKLVFFESAKDCIGHLVHVTISKSSPWSLQGELIEQ